MPSDKHVVYDYTRMLSGAVGTKHGLSRSEIASFEKKAKAAHEAIASQRADGKLPFMDLHRKKREAAEIIKYADAAARGFDNFVVLGIGGSALGTTALQSALNPAYFNLMTDKQRAGRPRLFVEDNVEPDRIANLLEVLPLGKTLFNVVTKSGGTAETMAAFMIVRDAVARKLGKSAVNKHIVATTDKSKGDLRKIADREGLHTFIVPDGVGGRFSVLTPVSLLPAAVAGIDIASLLAGATAMDKKCSSPLIGKNPALMAAALQYICCEKKGKSIQVMLPYSNRLKDVADWFRQLWAESLGKKHSLDGKIVHAGQTPIKALGATDQHSQLQLYIEGPNDKTITLIKVKSPGRDVTIPKSYGDIPALAYLGGRSMGELLAAECDATEMALTANGRPNSSIILPRIDAHTVGQLLYMLEVETAYAGLFFNINTFDQPGVEQGKIATYALMGRPGFEKDAEAFNKFNSRLEPSII